MSYQFERTSLLIGKDALNKLKDKNVIIFGLGGVGGYVCEALVRSGIENFTIVDKDKVSISNINRQIIANLDTVGRYKTDLILERMKSINDKVKVTKLNMFYLPENSNQIDFSKYDYVIDCIDTVSAKIDIIAKAKENNTLVISSMGMGNKLNPLDIKIADISKTSVCPLARVMRYELRKRNIKNVKVCYSTEEPVETESKIDEESKKKIPGSISFVPSVAGLVIASEVIKDLIK